MALEAVIFAKKLQFYLQSQLQKIRINANMRANQNKQMLIGLSSDLAQGHDDGVCLIKLFLPLNKRN